MTNRVLTIAGGGCAIFEAGVGISTTRTNGTITVTNTAPWTDSSNSYIQNQTATDQSASFRISGTGLIGGNEGIGTTSPLYALDVNGTMRVVGDSTFGGNVTFADGKLLDLSGILHDDAGVQGLKLPQNTSLTNISGGSEGYIAYDTNLNKVKIFNGTDWVDISGASTTLQEAYEAGKTIQLSAAQGDLRFYTDSSDEALFVQETNGFIGMGTTLPQNKLDVMGSLGIGTTQWLAVGPTNGLIVEGNVGLGLTAPTQKLDVAGKVKVGT